MVRRKYKTHYWVVMNTNRTPRLDFTKSQKYETIPLAKTYNYDQLKDFFLESKFDWFSTTYLKIRTTIRMGLYK